MWLLYFSDWHPWLVATIALIALSYGPPLAHLIAAVDISSPGLRVW